MYFTLRADLEKTCWITGNEISFGHASTHDFKYWVSHNMPLAIRDREWEKGHH